MESSATRRPGVGSFSREVFRWKDKVVKDYVVDSWWYPEVLTPDALTYVRLGIGIFFTGLFICFPSFAYRTLVIVLFTIGSLSDWLDGSIARARGITTVRGDFWDPFADKMLVLPLTTYYLWGSEQLLVWLILIGEAISQILRVVGLSKHYSISGNEFGKWKTILQVVAIYIMLFGYIGFGAKLLYIAFGLGIAGVMYRFKYPPPESIR